MRKRSGVILLLAALLVLGVLMVVIWGGPRLLEYSPAESAQDVPLDAPVRLTFSRPLQPAALQGALRFEPLVSGSYSWQDSTLVFQPDQPWPAGSTVRVQLLPGVPAAGFLPLRLRRGAEWSFKVHQPGLAYLFPADGPASLYLLDLDLAESRPLRQSAAGVLDFTVSPGGEQIYFSERLEPDGSAIFRLDLGLVELEAEPPSGEPPALNDGQAPPDPLNVLDCAGALCRALAVDPLGRFLAYERTAMPGSEGLQVPQVWLLPLVDGSAQAPFLAGDPQHQTESPSWSSTGRLAFYDADEQAYIFFEPGVVEREEFPNQTGQQGAWSPDGGAFLAPEIRYLNANVSPELSNLESLADSHLMLFHLDGERLEDLTPGEGIEDAFPAYSPDGEFLVFARKYLDVKRWTPGRQLWIARVDSRESRALSDAPLYNHYDFAWGPTSDQLAFVRFDQSALTEPPEIWVFDLPTSQARRLVQGGYKPLWIP